MKTKIAILLCAHLTGLAALAGGSNGPGEYLAHEWGTFTSVQGADGTLMAWNPLNVAELPDFVYSLAWPDGKKVGRRNDLAGKTGFFALQRMETPVIYFYADEPQSVNASVKFPRGTITEWYPQAARANPFGEAEVAKGRVERGSIYWKNIQLLPKGDGAAAPRRDSSGSHYYAARETDATAIRVNSPAGSEFEKFLFYRGVGSFETPLRVTQQGDDAETIELRNTGPENLRHLLVYKVEGDRASWSVLTTLAPEESKTVRLQFERTGKSRTAFAAEAGSGLRKALVADGLYEREAAAMVKTWEDSWFEEQGIRVLYLLPRNWTDETLPLTLTPAPRQVARVMVGRAELITPAIETSLLHEMVRYAGNDEVARAQAIENVRKLGLGRFSEAVMRRILSRVSLTREFSNRSWELLQAANKGSESKHLAQN